MTIKYSSKEVIEIGRDVLNQEASELSKSAKQLDEEFNKAVHAMYDCKGKIITTGLGKSGYIARKMASTLSSTGTASFYLHPAEALHGDFGMIESDDCLVAFAYGGETREVVAVSQFAKKNKSPVVCVTGNKKSSLAKISDFVILANVEKEADSLGLAPTASSTVSLGLADALAVALMKAKGFTENEFAYLHPGGSLGKKLALVENFMQDVSGLARLTKENNFHEVLKAVTEQNFGIAAVIDEESHVVGSISDGDLRRALLKYGGKAVELKAADLMGSSPKMVVNHSFVMDAAAFMEQSKITSLFVVSNLKQPKYLGLLRLHDLIAAKII